MESTHTLSHNLCSKVVCNYVEKSRLNRYEQNFRIWTASLNRGAKCAISSLDGLSANTEIVEHLATKYRALFTSQRTSEADLKSIERVIQDKFTSEGNSFVVAVSEVNEMISKLNKHKSDGMRGTSSDHFVYAPQRFSVLFTMLINAMLVHGDMPGDMLSSVLVPICFIY